MGLTNYINHVTACWSRKWPQLWQTSMPADYCWALRGFWGICLSHVQLQQLLWSVCMCLCVSEIGCSKSVSFFFLWIHTTHTWYECTLDSSPPMHHLPPANKLWMSGISSRQILHHPKPINLILMFHHQREPDRQVIVETMSMTNSHPFPPVGWTKYPRFRIIIKKNRMKQDGIIISGWILKSNRISHSNSNLWID